MITRFVRTRSGNMIHKSGCKTAGRSPIPWHWAEGKDDEDVWMAATENALKFCRVCNPCDASTKTPLYGMDGRLISVRDARALMLNFDARKIAMTQLDFMGHDLAVVTSFVPVDHGETHGTYTRAPACWETEILGGPPDIDGTKNYATSEDEAASLHADVVGLAIASGCTLR